MTVCILIYTSTVRVQSFKIVTSISRKTYIMPIVVQFFVFPCTVHKYVYKGNISSNVLTIVSSVKCGLSCLFCQKNIINNNQVLVVTVVNFLHVFTSL
jgi:hypothetical protein